MQNPDYLDFVRELPCAVCDARGPSEAHHPRGAVFGSGMGMKAPDLFAIPLCRKHHKQYHDKPDSVDQQFALVTTLLLAIKAGRLTALTWEHRQAWSSLGLQAPDHIGIHDGAALYNRARAIETLDELLGG